MILLLLLLLIIIIVIIIESEIGKSPLTVLQRALTRSSNEEYDCLLVDTSGRLSNNFELTEELIVSDSLIYVLYLNIL
jgi:signal recognition particle GTPase